MRLCISKKSCPSVRLSRVMFERQIWPFLKVKSHQVTSQTMIYTMSDDEVVASYLPPRYLFLLCLFALSFLNMKVFIIQCWITASHSGNSKAISKSWGSSLHYFLDATTPSARPYVSWSVRPSVGPSVRPLVRLSAHWSRVIVEWQETSFPMFQGLKK